MSSSQADVTTLLNRASQGDKQAQGDVYRLLEADLVRLARALLRHERPGPNLETMVLVNDAFLKLVGDPEKHWESRAQFCRLVAHKMRQLLVDQARHRSAARRAGNPAPLEAGADIADPHAGKPLELLALDDALTNLAQTHPDLSELVDLHHFLGLRLNHIAEAILHVPYITVKRKWERARAMLRRAMEGNCNGP
jgi:RNA polymerase sigma factor (TIGR02999 family)